MNLKRFLGYEWDAIAGILAAVAAIVLHLLHVVDEAVILPIVLALLGLLFVNFMRHTRNNELTAEEVSHTAHAVRRIQAGLTRPEIVLVGPRQLRSVSERFARDMSGDSVWFNVCLSMYVPDELFDALLRPAIENPHVSSIQFVLDASQQPLWEAKIQPRIAACAGQSKVRDPRWCDLDRNVSFILADNRQSGGAEALLSFWGEPFMAQSTQRDVPRYIFHVQKHSELLPHLMELERGCQRREDAPR
ncbi:guanosine polyphosphate pyrophosphohydrolases/synthetases [Thiohalobacter thiocyanaticus]|uniref:Guanosine polyphosphate pyrophosphohydrolases/synthetases n=1 Tax=Thiohalobacter thiocyanaticus TaxID=585455 RepID=A0A1Z4VQH4_9GAMM|nr:hypothetical protein [Thiohalobacter thiocyanaticus]BAZ93662.1 guanosine polyphosphate pyrophosphohydrolases/synthetases [Thiohalobacter thiocyanaticus]